jgi:hypothetical protein
MSYHGYRVVYWRLGVFITCGASGCIFLCQVSRFKNWAARYDRLGWFGKEIWLCLYVEGMTL